MRKPMPMPSGAGLTISELHEAYASGLSTAATIEHIYAEIEEVDDPGIFITLLAKEQALARARALPPFDPVAFPLWGVPFAVKDNIDVEDIETTCACPAFAYVPAATAPVVEKLLAAGALCIGKTNLDQFATGLVGVRTPYPVPRNAIDPTFVPGGSSSGSAVAVAHGLVSFALGTDTAGSGRVPAALNNIVGLKPSLGAISTRGVVPACQTLDCVSIFAGTVDDAWRVFEIAAVYDKADPYSRRIERGVLDAVPRKPLIGLPRAADLEFFGDRAAKAAFAKACDGLARLGASFREIDMRPFYATAALLYEGAWVAERQAALRPFLRDRAGDMFPVTLGILEGASRYSAADLFDTIYKVAALRRETEAVWNGIAALAVPAVPNIPSLADVAADPIGANTKLGTYTNFVNLLDLAALSVPGPFRRDGLAAGITLIGPSGSDALLASIGRTFHISIDAKIGATGRPVPAPLLPIGKCPPGMIEIAVVGAHLSGMPLNGELLDAGGVFLRETITKPLYRLYALPGGSVPKPALVRCGSGGFAIEVEVWALPSKSFGPFIAKIPPPLSVGTVLLNDESAPKGFLGETVAVAGAEDISASGGWRGYLASCKAAEERERLNL
jgi:allophanate hydrolase